MSRKRLRDIPDALFRESVARNTTLRGAIHELHLHDHTATYKRMRRRIIKLGIDTSHFRYGAGSRPSYTADQLREAVSKSRSMRQTLIHLGLAPAGANYATAKREISKLGIDISHFTGQSWRRGNKTPMWPARPLDELLVVDSPAKTSSIRKRLLREAKKEHRCEGCGLSEWLGSPIPLELHHENGISNDHRLENLRLLCPNCHSRTDSYRARNIGRARQMTPNQLSIL